MMMPIHLQPLDAGGDIDHLQRRMEPTHLGQPDTLEGQAKLKVELAAVQFAHQPRGWLVGLDALPRRHHLQHFHPRTGQAFEQILLRCDGDRHPQFSHRERTGQEPQKKQCKAATHAWP